ncbi:hypothetical protein TNCV_1137551 [Trichonephila clavipes]|nr:hypothetical protein TNCV_1137551 [Trichonephila clavipes]
MSSSIDKETGMTIEMSSSPGASGSSSGASGSSSGASGSSSGASGSSSGASGSSSGASGSSSKANGSRQRARGSRQRARGSRQRARGSRRSSSGKNWFCPVLHENGEASCIVGEGVMVYSRGRQPMALGTILSGTLHYSTNLVNF